MIKIALLSATIAVELLWIVIVTSMHRRATFLLILAVMLLVATVFSPSPRRVGRAAGGAFLLLVGLAAGVILAGAIDWLPRRVIRRLAMTPGAILRPSGNESGLIANLNAIRRGVIEQNLVRNLRRRVVVAKGGSDEARILDLLTPLKTQVLNEFLIPHQAESWPVLLAGLGWCDQVNSVGTEMLASDFPRSQIFALYDPVEESSTHTIGRGGPLSVETGSTSTFSTTTSSFSS